MRGVGATGLALWGPSFINNRFSDGTAEAKDVDSSVAPQRTDINTHLNGDRSKRECHSTQKKFHVLLGKAAYSESKSADGRTQNPKGDDEDDEEESDAALYFLQLQDSDTGDRGGRGCGPRA